MGRFVNFLTTNFSVILCVFLVLIFLQNFKWKGWNYYLAMVIAYANPRNWVKTRYRFFLVNVQIYKEKYGKSKGNVSENRRDELKYVKDNLFGYETTGCYPNKENLLIEARKRLDKDGKLGYIFRPNFITELTHPQYLEWIANAKTLKALKQSSDNPQEKQ